MSVEVRPVGSRQELREFIELPFRLHSTSPQWVPPLRLERRLFLSRRLNAVLQARRRAAVPAPAATGASSGASAPRSTTPSTPTTDDRWGMFGFLELEDDPEVLAALLAAAEGWLRARGRDRMVGPMDFTMNDEAGVLVEGYDREPLIRQPWHPPYYAARCEEAGLEKAMDL